MDFSILLIVSYVNLMSLLDIYLDINMSNAFFECLIIYKRIVHKKFRSTYFNENELKILPKEQLPSREKSNEISYIALFLPYGENFK